MCSCGIGKGLSLGKGMREELDLNPGCRYIGGLKPGCESAAISSGVLRSKFIGPPSNLPSSSCCGGGSNLWSCISLISEISGSWLRRLLVYWSRLCSRLRCVLLSDLPVRGTLIPASCISWLSIASNLSLCIHLERSGSSSSKYPTSSIAPSRSILSMLSTPLLGRPYKSNRLSASLPLRLILKGGLSPPPLFGDR